MKQIFEITDEVIIRNMLERAEYGTLALCTDNKPYSVPVNFVELDGNIYFHGAQKGRKMSMISKNMNVSFSVVENYSLIPSYFSSNDGLACPATQFFKSIIVDGVVEVVESREEKAAMFEALMQKLQPEGKYKPFHIDEYDTMLKATAVLKIVPVEMSAKFKFGQHVTAERFEMICEHLEARGEKLDLETLALMKSLRAGYEAEDQNVL